MKRFFDDDVLYILRRASVFLAVLALVHIIAVLVFASHQIAVHQGEQTSIAVHQGEQTSGIVNFTNGVFERVANAFKGDTK